MTVGADVWKATDLAKDQGVQGLKVSLDSSNSNAPLYTIKRNTLNSIVIETSDDLSIYSAHSLIGVHTFETINVTRGAYVDFGEDRVIINDLLNSNIDETSGINLSNSSTLIIEHFKNLPQWFTYNQTTHTPDVTLDDGLLKNINRAKFARSW